LQALKLNPEGHFLYAKLGLIYLAAERFPQALNILEQLMEKEKQQSRLSAEAYREAWYLLTVAIAQNQKVERARDELHLFLRQYPDHPEALDLLQQVEQVLFKK
jgi:tetratricopeptide (TPR) repeat protein